MIDDLVLVMDIDPPNQAKKRCRIPFQYLGLVFSPRYRGNDVICYESNLKNLRLKLSYDKLILSGSWHKFFHGGNWGDYTWHEIGLTLKDLHEKFGEAFLNARITKLTYACNLVMDPKPILSKIKTIKGAYPSNMSGGTNHKPYGKYHKMTHYRFKIYDKQTEVKIHDNLKIEPILRIEKETKMNAARKRLIDPINTLYPMDLLKPEFYRECLYELLSVIFNIEFLNSIQVSELVDIPDNTDPRSGHIDPSKNGFGTIIC